MEKIFAPFTDEQVKNLNEFQSLGLMHPFTCMSPDHIAECHRKARQIGNYTLQPTDDGDLIATTGGWVCPCGKYKQTGHGNI